MLNWDMQSFIVTLIVLMTSMPVHECAHAWAHSCTGIEVISTISVTIKLCMSQFSMAFSRRKCGGALRQTPRPLVYYTCSRVEIQADLPVIPFSCLFPENFAKNHLHLKAESGRILTLTYNTGVKSFL